MKIAIHASPDSFSKHWIEYCKQNAIPLKQVNCYSNNIVEDLKDCDALMWHFHNSNSKDVLFAKQLLFSIQTSGKVVFPDAATCWHFDDKIGQKYLLESINAPLVPTYVFYEKQDAINWIENTEFPKVFKQRRGSGSNHVKLVKNKMEARSLVRKAFGRGFPQYNPLSNLIERWRKYISGKAKIKDLLKGIVRLGYPTRYSKVVGKERGYIYFQDFIPNNNYDIRLHVVSGKCFGCVRMVRPGDFRASGSGEVSYDFNKIPLKAIESAFEIAQRLNLKSVAFDFVLHQDKPKILEMSYGFGVDPDDFKFGYWNSNLEFIEGEFNPYGWMVDSVVNKIKWSKTTEDLEIL